MIVREMFLTNDPVFSNIVTKGISNNTLITKEDIFKTEVTKVKKNGEEVHKYVLNREFWEEQRDKNPVLNVVVDEAHTLINPRRSMSKKNEIMTDFLALLRRVVGTADGQSGELVLISQLERRLDVIAREMATLVQYVFSHYTRHCVKHGDLCREMNETPNQMKSCPHCGRATNKKDFIIEVYSFKNIYDYHEWQEARNNNKTKKKYFEHYMITDIETIFKNYNTLQWDNLLSE